MNRIVSCLPPFCVYAAFTVGVSTIWAPERLSDLFCNAQLCAACARVNFNFRLGGQNGFAGNHFQRGIRAAHAHRKTGRACAFLRMLGSFLHRPICQGVIADDRDATAGFNHRMAASRPRRSTVSSPFTSMRSAWNVRLAGCPPARRAEAGMAALIMSTSSPVVSTGGSRGAPR